MSRKRFNPATTLKARKAQRQRNARRRSRALSNIGVLELHALRRREALARRDGAPAGHLPHSQRLAPMMRPAAPTDDPLLAGLTGLAVVAGMAVRRDRAAQA